MLMRMLVCVLALVAASACERGEKRDDHSGLPPADDWQAPPASPSHFNAGGSADPHAGMDMNNPHAGMNMNDPHAGMNMDDSHGGVDPAMGMAPPDPNRAIDPSKYLRGTIAATDETRDKIKPGAILFLSVRPIDPTTGSIIGGPLAVDRLDITKLPLSFELTEAHSMVAGTEFAGDVVIQARIDGDGEARTKERGDIEGSVRATVPAADLKLSLDTILR